MSLSPTRNLLALVGISFFSTFATMMVLSVLPAFFTQTLKLTPIQMGKIEGAAVLTAYLSKFFAGIFSDHLKKRKCILVWGTALSVLSKACFALATGFLSVFLVQVGDRLAKGLRSCPADAMIADLTSMGGMSSRQYYNLKHVAMLSGSVVGAIVTRTVLSSHFFTHVLGGSYKFVFALATLPCLCAFFLASRALQEATLVEPQEEKQPSLPFWRSLKSLSFPFFCILLVCFLLMFARFSISFVGRRALDIGIQPKDWAVLTVMYDSCAVMIALLCCLWRGWNNGIKIFKLAVICHIGAHTLFFLAISPLTFTLGTILAGVFLGASQGVVLSFVAGSVPKECRATAFALYYLVVGFGGLLSNRLAGRMCEILHSSSGAFLGGCVFSILTLWFFSLLIKPKADTDHPQI